MFPRHVDYSLLAFCLFVLCVAARPAHAYIDPGTGSYVFQIAIASVVTALFVLKGAIRRVFDTLFGKKNAMTEDERRDG